MQERLIFLIGAPRSGTTLLARMMGAHSAIHQRAEPHLITPIAHLGYYAKVQKAPYDPQNAEQAIRELVADLPRGEEDYLDALRAYADTLYGRMLASAPGKRFFLDKTPAYALVLPFLTRLYPKAHYVVLTRHPLAVLSSWVESFFDGDYQVALDHNPLLARYVPALARMLRERPVPFVHLKARHTRPVTSSVSRWAAEIAAKPATLALVSKLVDQLDPADLETLGYPRAGIVEQLEAARGASVPLKREAPTRYALERKLLVALRRNIHHNRLGRVLKRLRFALDVVLRE